MIDIDSVEIGWEDGNPVPLSLIETKRFGLKKLSELTSVNNNSIKVQKNIADRLGVPFFVVLYKFWNDKLNRIVGAEDGNDVKIDSYQFQVAARNKIAKGFVGNTIAEMNYNEYVDFLKDLRR